MILLFIISQLAVAIIANSVHKYPYVFLLDVGNEEIQNLNTEQIRFTISGGSLAIKYPATGEGDTIRHVRVSGIDFGTNLKASIVQGGPGYKYVVLVFLGNPGVSYNAVVTLQTESNVDSSNMNSDTENKSSDSNDSAEETDDSTQQKTTYSENALITQSSSNVYKYINSGHSDVNDNDNDNGDETQNNDEEEGDNEDDKDQSNQENSDDDIQSGTYLESDNSENTAEIKPLGSQNDERYGKYEAFKPVIIGGVRFYPQAAIYSQDGYSKPIYDQENHVDDEENEQSNDNINDIDYKDSNNNLSSDYVSPVEY
ncbi:unnamed protein product, partial [Brenthis ino]